MNASGRHVIFPRGSLEIAMGCEPRGYETVLGRRHFLQPDPIGFAGGDINLYRAMANNPVNMIDPLGLQGFWSAVGTVLSGAAAGAAGGAVTGAAIGAGVGAFAGGVGAGPGALAGLQIGAYAGAIGGAISAAISIANPNATFGGTVQNSALVGGLSGIAPGGAAAGLSGTGVVGLGSLAGAVGALLGPDPCPTSVAVGALTGGIFTSLGIQAQGVNMLWPALGPAVSQALGGFSSFLINP